MLSLMHEQVRPDKSEAGLGWLASYGLALVIAGQPIGWWVRGTFTSGESPVFPAAVVLLGMALLFLGSRERPAIFYAAPPIFLAPLMLIVVPVVVLALTQPQLMAVDIFYGLFMLLIIPIIACTRLERLAGLPIAVIVVGSISGMLALFSLITNPVEEALLRLTVAGNDNPIIIANIGATVVFAALCYVFSQHLSRAMLVLISIFIIVSLGNVLLSNTRSAFLGLTMSVIFVFMFSRRQNSTVPTNMAFFGLILTLLIVIVCVFAIRIIGLEQIVQITSVFNERIFGALSLLDAEGMSAQDQSTQERVVMLEEVWTRLSIFGNGVSAQARWGHGFALPGDYAHLSYLQVIYDLGIIPFVVYLVLMLAIPLALVVNALRSKTTKPVVVFVIGLWLYRQVDLFTHGTPYDWQNLFPTMLLYAVLARESIGLIRSPQMSLA